MTGFPHRINVKFCLCICLMLNLWLNLIRNRHKPIIETYILSCFTVFFFHLLCNHALNRDFMLSFLFRAYIWCHTKDNNKKSGTIVVIVAITILWCRCCQSLQDLFLCFSVLCKSCFHLRFVFSDGRRCRHCDAQPILDHLFFWF